MHSLEKVGCLDLPHGPVSHCEGMRGSGGGHLQAINQREGPRIKWLSVDEGDLVTGFKACRSSRTVGSDERDSEIAAFIYFLIVEDQANPVLLDGRLSGCCVGNRIEPVMGEIDDEPTEFV